MIKFRSNQRHSFRPVDPSPRTLVAAFSAFMLTFGTAMFMYCSVVGSFLLQSGVL